MPVAAAEKPKRTPASLVTLLRDGRVIQVITQIVFIVLLVAVLSIVFVNILRTLEERRLSIYFDVMTPPSGFQLSESPSWFTSDDSFGKAFVVGIYHTLQIVVPGLVLATLIGVFIGIFLLSRNWLIRNISKAYVEVLRNTPLLVQLYFWYFIVFFALPSIRAPIAFPPEGVTFIHFRIPVYGLLILGVWWLSNRASYPSRVTTGAFIGIVLMELALRLTGTVPLSFVLYTALALVMILAVALKYRFNFSGQVLALAEIVLGAALIAVYVADINPLVRTDLLLAGGSVFIMTMVLWFGTKGVGEFAKGYLIILVGQVIITGLYLHLLYFLDLSPLPDSIMLQIHPVAFFSIKGMALPELAFTSRFGEWMAFVVAGIVIAIVVWLYAGHVTETTGKPIPRGGYAPLTIFAMMLFGWIFVTAQPIPDQIAVGEGEEAVMVPYEQALMSADITPNQEYTSAWYPVKLVLPEKNRLSYTRGTVVTPEYSALLIGLVIYTSAFIAEIVRAGIQAVPYGQLEAARALGLSYPQTLQLIILPQALRVIIPPLGNQYLNLAKNSSLAIAVAFSDTYQVGQTMMNTSGQSIVGFAMIFLVYITMSLIISFGMNLVNARFQLVTR